MPPRSKRKPTRSSQTYSSASRDTYQRGGLRLKRLRPYRDVEIVRHDYHMPSSPRRLITRQRLTEDPRNYDEAYLRRASTPLPKPPPLYPRHPKAKLYDPAFCRRQKIRRAVMFAMGAAGTGGRLPRRIRVLRARRYRRTYHNRVKC